jgi:hypothetical protein
MLDGEVIDIFGIPPRINSHPVAMIIELSA